MPMTNKGQAIIIIIIVKIINKWGDNTNPLGLSTVATCPSTTGRVPSKHKADNAPTSIIRKWQIQGMVLRRCPLTAGTGKSAARQLPRPHYVLTNKTQYTNNYHSSAAAHLSLHNPPHANMLGAHRQPNPANQQSCSPRDISGVLCGGTRGHTTHWQQYTHM